jgi:hypothetical protein
MGAIKGVVIGLGLLILAGFVVVAVTLVTRMQGLDEERPPFSSSISVPQGAQIAETVPSDRTLVLRLALPDGSAALLMIDAESGNEVGRVRLIPQAP